MEIEKVDFPTSAYTVACDTFDVTLEARLHKASANEVKLNLVLDGGDQLSLYLEDVELLIEYLNSIKTYIKPRN